jgi:RNA polymerase sigma factor (sigma-70 family)
MGTLTDAELWQQVRHGEPSALGELYRRHALAIHRYCLWRTAAKHLAEDVAATVFLEGWRRRRRLDLTTASARPLLLGLATRVLRNYWRIQRRHAEALERIGKADLSPWDEDEVVARVDAMSEVREAGAAIRALPPRDREVLALLAWGGLSQEETAVALGVPVETVRSRAARRRSCLDEAAETSDLSLLLPDGSTLATRRPVLEVGCERTRSRVLYLGSGRRGWSKWERRAS